MGAIIVEKALEKIRTSLKNAMQPFGYSITGCYSPGYCDWPLSEQKKYSSYFLIDFATCFLAILV